jgi:hypothetical protein
MLISAVENLFEQCMYQKNLSEEENDKDRRMCNEEPCKMNVKEKPAAARKMNMFLQFGMTGMMAMIKLKKSAMIVSLWKNETCSSSFS